MSSLNTRARNIAVFDRWNFDMEINAIQSVRRFSADSAALEWNRVGIRVSDRRNTRKAGIHRRYQHELRWKRHTTGARDGNLSIFERLMAPPITVFRARANLRRQRTV